jgi:dihydrofolate reductase/thymidylate synthase
MINIVVAFTTKSFGIGKNNTIPWHLPEDLKRFQELTLNKVVVMGHKTYLSIPNHPLKNRVNIVVTNNPHLYVSTKDVMFVSVAELDTLLTSFKEVFIIGGTSVYRKYMGIADKIYATLIEKEYDCDVIFPIENFGKYRIKTFSPKKVYNDVSYQFIEYIKSDKKHGEYVYLEHMKDVLINGDIREDRTGTGTKSLFGGQLRFDISESIPMLTTKFVPFQLTVKELLFFLKGQTDCKILEKQGVNIWKGNTSREFLDKKGLVDYEEGDMGPMYSFILTSIGLKYKGCNYDYSKDEGGINQLDKLIKGLKEDPWSRRHLMTTFCPTYAEQGVLYPCHGIVINAYYSEKNNNKYVSLHVYIRSSDGFLGLPINILSYSILTYIIAKKCGYLPYELIISFGDRHLYLNHLDQVKTQLERNILPFPVLKVNDSIIKKDFKDIELTDFEVIGYLSHPKISAPMAI